MVGVFKIVKPLDCWCWTTRSTVKGRYTLKRGERWTLLSDDRVMVIHPDRPPKIVYPDGRVEEIASKPDA